MYQKPNYIGFTKSGFTSSVKSSNIRRAGQTWGRHQGPRFLLVSCSTVLTMCFCPKGCRMWTLYTDVVSTWHTGGRGVRRKGHVPAQTIPFYKKNNSFPRGPTPSTSIMPPNLAHVAIPSLRKWAFLTEYIIITLNKFAFLSVKKRRNGCEYAIDSSRILRVNLSQPGSGTGCYMKGAVLKHSHYWT